MGDELFVCDKFHHTIRVFSMGGEHLRDITGVWRLPQINLIVHRGRLFMINQKARAIFVLAPDGELLQKYEMKTDDGRGIINWMHVLGHRLIVSCRTKNGDYRLLALMGL